MLHPPKFMELPAGLKVRIRRICLEVHKFVKPGAFSHMMIISCHEVELEQRFPSSNTALIQPGPPI